MPPKRKSASKLAVKAPAGKAGKAGKTGKAGKSATASKAPAKAPASKAAPAANKAGKTATASKTSAGKTAAKTSAGKTAKAAAGKAAAGKGGEYTKTARKDKDGRVVYRRAGSSADYVRRKDATGAIVYRALTAARGGAEEDMIGGSPLSDAFKRFKGTVQSRFSQTGLCRYGTTDVNGACIRNTSGNNLGKTNHLELEHENKESPAILQQSIKYGTDNIGNNLINPIQETVELEDNIIAEFVKVRLILSLLNNLILNIKSEEEFTNTLTYNRQYYYIFINDLIIQLQRINVMIREKYNPYTMNTLPPIKIGGSLAAYHSLKSVINDLNDFLDKYDINDTSTYTPDHINDFISRFEAVKNMVKSIEEMLTID